MEPARNVKDVSPHKFMKAYAAHLKRSGKMELPKWTDIVKTGKLKELAPYDPDWYYIRAASMARKIYLRGCLGVGGFRRIYGRNQRNGSRPRHFCKSSGSVARNILQQLQNITSLTLIPRVEGEKHPMAREISTKLLEELLLPFKRDESKRYYNT